MAYAEVVDEQKDPNLRYLQELISLLAVSRQPKQQDDLLVDKEVQDSNSPAMMAFQRHLANAPVRKERSNSEKFLSGLVGAFLGPEKAWEAADRPHKQAIEDWRMKGAGLERLANMETEGRNRRSTQDLSILGTGLREMNATDKTLEASDRADRTADALADYRGRMAGAAERRADIAEKAAESGSNYRAGMLGEQQKRTKIMQGGLEVRKEQQAMIRNAPTNAGERARLANNDRQLQIALTQQSRLGKYFGIVGGHTVLEPKTLENAPEEDVTEIRNILRLVNLDKIFLPSAPPTRGNITNAPPVIPQSDNEEEEEVPSEGW